MPRTYSWTLLSSLWSADKQNISPSADSKMQRESPTDATVIDHPSIIAKVTVVPDACPDCLTSKKVTYLTIPYNYKLLDPSQQWHFLS